MDVSMEKDGFTGMSEMPGADRRRPAHVAMSRKREPSEMDGGTNSFGIGDEASPH
jgi:hypothetical protein